MRVYVLMLAALAGFSGAFAQYPVGYGFITGRLKASFDLSGDKVERVMQFNRDTFLIAGWLGNGREDRVHKNVVYQTFDSGRTWKMQHFKGDGWINDACFQSDGKVWMGGSDKYIHYSEDYGTSWLLKPMPMVPENRVSSVYMADSLNGVTGGLYNGLALTRDNWVSSLQLPSPFDQHMFHPNRGPYNSVGKVGITDSFILVNQHGHICYSRLRDIQWKAFSVPVKDFVVDRQKRVVTLHGFGDKVYVLDFSLNLKDVYYKPEEKPELPYTPGIDVSAFLLPGNNIPRNSHIDVASFISCGIQRLQINAVKHKAENKRGICFSLVSYTENAKTFSVTKQKALAEIERILTTYEQYIAPRPQAFVFSKKDWRQYWKYYNEARVRWMREAAYGDDFSALINPDNEGFLFPHSTIDSLNDKLVAPVYREVAPSDFPELPPPHFEVKVVNHKSDTLLLTSKGSGLYTLPWTVAYKGNFFRTYDTRLTALVRELLPARLKYSDQLRAGELIYRLVEQNVANKMQYEKSE